MKAVLIILSLLLLAGLGYVSYAHFSGGAVPTFGLPIGGEKARIRSQTLRFFEHIKFKNKNALQSFVESDVEVHDIEQFISKIFDDNLANIDLQKISIDSIELDSLQKRSRVRIKLFGQDLLKSAAFEKSKIIYLFENDNNSWLIDIKNMSP